ncbi:hypothetical protein TSAR_000202 [Trichomalopsis sarcophagae]|uniref:Uncharacterized protein n=1 Tax=Trichomalopsis sarcophagae TaxID=543379 RepID=A0A232FD74_9HYME|nr:hypothetical protein TSAR_000202 [Trichomalopsis sarcophagae]
MMIEHEWKSRALQALETDTSAQPSSESEKANPPFVVHQNNQKKTKSVFLEIPLTHETECSKVSAYSYVFTIDPESYLLTFEDKNGIGGKDREVGTLLEFLQRVEFKNDKTMFICAILSATADLLKVWDLKDTFIDIIDILQTHIVSRSMWGFTKK